MVSDAESHAAEDKVRRQEVEIRNSADSTVYQVQRQLNEAGNRLPVHEKSRIEQLLSETRQALNNNAPIEQIHKLTGDLTQAANAFNAAPRTESPTNTEAAPKTDGPEDVIDAEYTEK